MSTAIVVEIFSGRRRGRVVHRGRSLPKGTKTKHLSFGAPLMPVDDRHGPPQSQPVDCGCKVTVALLSSQKKEIKKNTRGIEYLYFKKYFNF